MDEQASPKVALFLRIDTRLHAQVRRAAAARHESVTAFVQHLLSRELRPAPAGHRVAEAIRNGSRGAQVRSGVGLPPIEPSSAG